MPKVVIGSWFGHDWYDRRGAEFFDSRVVSTSGARITLELTQDGLEDLIEDAKFARDEYDYAPDAAAAGRVLKALAKQGFKVD